MKERISQIAKGIIGKEPPVFTVTPDKISRKIEAGKSISCDLMIRTRSEFPIKGLVLTSDPHITISCNGFAGYVCRVLLEVRAGLGEEGKNIEGHLTIVTEAGEMEIPYSIPIVSAEGLREELPETVEQFARMAQENWKKASDLFLSPLFLRCAFFQDMDIFCQYQGLIRGNSPMYAMEEFFVALGLKNPAVIEAQNITEENHGAIEKVVFLLKQKEWGYAEVCLDTKPDRAGEESFLSCHRKWNTFDLMKESSDGSFQEVVELPILEERLHAGFNEAVIEVTDGKRLVIHKIRIKLGNGCSPEHKQMQKDKKAMLQAITGAFAGKSSGKETGQDTSRRNKGARQLAELSAELRERYPRSWSLPLIQAAAWMEAGERERAMALLYQVKGSIFSRRYEELQCYQLYLYLEEALKGADADGSGCQSLREDYKKKRDYLVFYYLTEIDVQWIGKPGKVLQELETFFQQGIHSPLLYWKACQVLKAIPDFMNIKSAFQRQALYFGVNYDLLPLEIMVHAAVQVLEQENPHWFLYRILSHMYGRTQNRVILQALIYVLIRHDKRGRNYFSWYELGMKENFNQQGLARYYILSAPEAWYQPFLKQVLLYYSYEDNLEPELQEKLYTNVYQFYLSDSRIYALYSSRIEKLMAERMMQGKMDDNLAYLYRCMIHPNMVDRKMAEELPELLHMKRVVGLLPSARCLILRYPELDMEVQVQCFRNGQDREKTANIPVHSKHVFFFQEDEEGRRMALPNIQAKQWICREDLEEMCRKQNPNQFGFQIQFLQQFLRKGLQDENDANKLLMLAEKLPVSAPFVDQIVREMVDFCKDHPEYEDGDGILLGLDITALSREQQKKVMDMLIAKEFLVKAQENMQKIGWEDLDAGCRKAYFSLWRADTPNFFADSRMIALSRTIVKENPSFREALEYLCAFYSGSQEEMMSILQKSISAGCSLYHMPERLLVQSIFSGKWDALDLIFTWYLQFEEPEPLPVKAAYVILCYQYFVLRQNNLDHWMREPFLERIFNKKPPAVCVLARLSFLSVQEFWQESWKEEAQKLILGLLEKEQYFGFYHGLFCHIPMPVWLEGRVILEYHGEAQKKLILEYERIGWDPEKISVRMEEVYPGVYTQQILVFGDEQLVYRIYEEDKGKQKDLCPPQKCEQKPFETAFSHMAVLNRIAFCLEQRQSDDAIREINRMEEEKQLMEVLFPIQQEE